ncbi:MAG TPA: Mini-ribonuclease 3 [Candidatus Onthoplasma faecigallinarum]|nr:Mini-ribonuclease 3 [Candidatus Onthoplasma faecigallinarum]
MENSSKNDAYLKNVKVLAYLGDSVFSFLVKKYLVENYQLKTNQLNKMANSVLCAKTQAEIMQKLDNLSNEEQDIVMRARNAHINSKAKNSSLHEYSLATQLEALVGFWCLNGNEERLKYLFDNFIKERL